MKLKPIKLRPLKFVNHAPVHGKDGKDGADGENGVPINGIDGIDGINGIAGNDGIDGVDGKDASFTDQQVKQIIRQARQEAREDVKQHIETLPAPPVSLQDLRYKKNAKGKIIALRKIYTDDTSDKWTPILGKTEVQKIVNTVLSGNGGTKKETPQYEEFLLDATDITNGFFTLAKIPLTGTQSVYLNGVFKSPLCDYTILGKKITWLTVQPRINYTFMVEYKT